MVSREDGERSDHHQITSFGAQEALAADRVHATMAWGPATGGGGFIREIKVEATRQLNLPQCVPTDGASGVPDVRSISIVPEYICGHH